MRLVPMRVFASALVNATAQVESGTLDLRSIEDVCGLTIQATSILGTPDCKLEIAYSGDGRTFGAYNDQDALLSSTNSAFGATPEGVHTQPCTLAPAPYAKIRATGNAANTADTLLTVTLQGTEL